MMTDQEAEKLYKGIMEQLRQHHLLEILNHIEEQIAEGKVVEEEVQTFKEQLGNTQNALPAFRSGTSHLKSAGKSPFSTIAPYTAKEQLEITINAIEQILFAPLEVREYLKTSFLERFSLQRLEFISPTQETLVSISRQDPLHFDQTNSINTFEKVLDQLREER
jgi:hypothetical protein